MTALAWMPEGACRSEDPGLFFPVSEIGPSLWQVERARTVCRRCPVLATCLRYAMDTGQHGIWGATTDGERRAMQQRARRHAAAHAMAGPRS
jgi:WhiB family transcriptional regulator, redox-sensing transcriptional regulator